MTAKPYTIKVQGIRRDDGTWIIEATATFAPGADREALGHEVRVGLLQGIVREGLNVRRAGGTIAEVILDEGYGPKVVRPSEVGLK
jgi:hypothetical protein